MRQLTFLLILFSCLLLVHCTMEIPEEVVIAYDKLPARLDFNYDVKPILSDKCFACHGPDQAKQKADLRLDTPEGAFAALKSNPNLHAIVAYKPSKSEAIQRILSDDASIVMPPPESNLVLSEYEIATLIKWVKQGAVYQSHWSFVRPEKKQLPKVKQQDWTKNAIDYFILQKMEQQDLSPSEPTSKENLIRRLSFDLTGLPPTLVEIEAFVNDNSEDAYVRLVDRLLNTPAYGERMAMDWMDVARYADSDGYLDDKHREFTPWRDWVIHAFNENMPYDQFATWQLAGDLIPDKSKESILATAFNRLHRKNSEAGIVFEEYRVEYVADRTMTLGKAFLGLTMECARCHDHKYDPISQEDYYKMFGFFNSTKEIGTAVYGPDQTPGPALLLSSEEQNEIIKFLNQNIDNEISSIDSIKQEIEREYQKWTNDKSNILRDVAQQQDHGLLASYPFDRFAQKDRNYTSQDVTQQNDVADLKEPEFREKGVFISDFTRIQLPKRLGWFESSDPFSIQLEVFPDTMYKEVGLFYHCENLRLGLKGYSAYLENNQFKFIIAHSWPNNAIQVRTKQALTTKEWTDITVTYDGSSQAEGIHVYFDGQEIPLTVDHDNLYKGITYQYSIHTYGYSGFQMGQRDKMELFKNGGFDNLKIYNRELTALEVLFQENPVAAKQTMENQRLIDNQKLKQFYTHQNASVKAHQKKLYHHRTSLRQLLDSIPEIMVMGDLPEPRPTFILDRGLYNAPIKEVQAGVPENIFDFDENLPKNRLGLTRWLFDPENPLTARVFVNRIWQMHFGKGLVKTADDFGNQGDLPTHPDLLDWLAVEFIESGWDIKHLHKLIVLSATYQQSSGVNEFLLEIDPENQLLARSPSFRLSAEMLRDNALAVSGLLVKQIGGMSVYPYQPNGLWDEISNKGWRYSYLQEAGDGLYRRSLYTIWKRTAPPPSMLIFDAPDRSVCNVNRRNTNTPLQSLVLLNDPQYIEAARVLAEQLMLKSELPQRQLQLAFQLLTGRVSDEYELQLLEQFYEMENQRFLAQEQDVMAYLSIGELPPNPNIDPTQLATLATVISGIMNTTDAYTRR